MYVYSGQCRLGTVGQPASLSDMDGDELFVGDIVIVFTPDYIPTGLTVVVGDEFKSFYGGTFQAKKGSVNHFVMGIKDVGDDFGEWNVKKVKDHSSVVNGEHWDDFGFSFKDR